MIIIALLAFSEKWGDLVSLVADRYSRDHNHNQKKRSKHDDPIRLQDVARNGVGQFFEFGLSDMK